MAVECSNVLSMANTPLETTWTSTLSTNEINHNCEDVKNIGSPKLGVTRAFEFIKENIMFDTLEDELMQRKLLLRKEKEDYVCKNGANCSKNERLIKLIIRKNRCEEFVKLFKEVPCHKHIFKRIMEVLEEEGESTPMGAVQEESSFIPLTSKLLQKLFGFLYLELEPREIADRMFQAGYIDPSEHDDITDSNKKYRRLRNLLSILKGKNLYEHFWCTLQSLKYTLVLDTLQKEPDRKLKNELCKLSEYACCIQHSFILLQEELPDTDLTTIILAPMLDESNINDIQSCSGAIRKTCKLLKIILMKKKPCLQETFQGNRN